MSKTATAHCTGTEFFLAASAEERAVLDEEWGREFNGRDGYATYGRRVCTECHGLAFPTGAGKLRKHKVRSNLPRR